MTTGSPGRALLALAATLVPAVVARAAELRVRPSVSLSQVHDDNVLAAPGAAREADHISRLGAGLTVGRRSSRLTMKARYEVEAEVFRRHPELNRAAARQDAALDIAWTASRRLGASLSAAYVDTQTPGELNLLTGLEVGRRRGRRLSTVGVLTQRMGPLSTATLEHRFARDRVVGAPGSDSHVVALGLERRLGPTDRTRLGYTVQRLDFGPDVTLSHILTLGWKRTVTSSAQFELEAGPRWTGGTLGAEVSAGFRHRLRGGDAELAYVHGQTTVLGHPGPVTVKGVRAAVSYRLVGPLRVSAGPGVFRILGRGSEGTIYRLGAEVAWSVARDVTLSAIHQFSLQEGGVGLARAADSEISRNTFLLTLTRRASRE